MLHIPHGQQSAQAAYDNILKLQFKAKYMKETNLNNTLNYYFEEINIKHIALHMIYKFEIQMHRKYSLFDA